MPDVASDHETGYVGYAVVTSKKQSPVAPSGPQKWGRFTLADNRRAQAQALVDEVCAAANAVAEKADVTEDDIDSLLSVRRRLAGTMHLKPAPELAAHRTLSKAVDDLAAGEPEDGVGDECRARLVEIEPAFASLTPEDVVANLRLYGRNVKVASTKGQHTLVAILGRLAIACRAFDVGRKDPEAITDKLSKRIRRAKATRRR